MARRALTSCSLIWPAPRVKGIWYDWHLAQTFDHVVVVVALDGTCYMQASNRLAMPPHFDANALEGTDEGYKQDLWMHLWGSPRPTPTT